MPRCGVGSDVHVLGIARSSILVVSGKVHDGTGGNGQINIVLGVTSTDLGALCVESNGDRAASVGGHGLAGIVNDGLVVVV